MSTSSCRTQNNLHTIWLGLERKLYSLFRENVKRKLDKIDEIILKKMSENCIKNMKPTQNPCIRGLCKRFVDTSELHFKYDRFQSLIVQLFEAICYEYLDQKYQQNG